ncbi:MAG: CotH kinase family protein, partial [Planctomycetota bacterium]
QRLPTRWRTVNTGKMFDNKRVGNFGLTERMNHNLWNTVGVPAPFMFTFHQRIVMRPDEAPDDRNGQYLGDFYGMYVAFEDYDPRFLDAHDLEDGNLYKLKDGQFQGAELRRNQGRFATKTDQDFQNIRARLRPQQTNEWLEAHVNYDLWYPYHAVVEGIRHYDFRPADSHSKNRAWYFEPDYSGSELGRVWTLPWDSDASWGPNWNDGTDYSKQAIFSGGSNKLPFRIKYRNFMRQFVDLIWTTEVIHQRIDDLALRVEQFHMADRDRWRGAPSTVGQQDFGPMATKVRDMKNFAFVQWSGNTGPTVPRGGRRAHLERLAVAEGAGSRIPGTPEVTATGPESFAADRLAFRSSGFEDPQEDDEFAAITWRIGEVADPNAEWSPTEPRVYEWPAVWEQAFDDSNALDVQIPRTAVKVGHRYRVRARMTDSTGRDSHWSNPIEFIVSEPEMGTAPESGLRITEIMYHPPGDSGFEFIELQNISGETIDLRDVAFVDGVDFEFRGSAIESLGAGEYAVIVSNLSAFEARYGPSAEFSVAGQYRGRLNNAGEVLRLQYGADVVVLNFEFDDMWYPETDGLGRSLVVADPAQEIGLFGTKEGWTGSRGILGSPGSQDVGLDEGSQLPGDIDQSGSVTISDAVRFLGILFRGQGQLPCGDGTIEHDSNQAILDLDGDQNVVLTDAIHLLNYLFLSGAPPRLGSDCVIVADCPSACSF